MKKAEERLTSDQIIEDCDRFRQNLWPIWMRERQLVGYYNGELVPSGDNNGEDCEDEEIVSLGMGSRFIKAPYDQLMDSILMKPGFISCEVVRPLNTKRKSYIERKLDLRINAVVSDRVEPLIKSCAGRAIITGRAFFFRLSKWDVLFKTGRLLHDINATDDINSEEFREWAFIGQITLREIDGHLSRLSSYKGQGWNVEGLKALKRHIIKKDSKDKELSEAAIDSLCASPFEEKKASSPLDVYWFFKKRERDNKGNEPVDLYCVSRFGTIARMERYENDKGDEIKYLGVKTDLEDQHILYHVPSAFNSISECLVACLLDSRVAGDQLLAQISGAGKIMLPRLLAMESLTFAALQGIEFAIQPNWTSAQGASIDEMAIRKLAKDGVAPWGYLPPGVDIMNKVNALTGFGPALSLIQSLGISADRDSGSGAVSSDIELKDIANQFLAQAASDVSRRAMRFHSALTKLSAEMVKTILRPLVKWNKNDPSYFSAKEVQEGLFFEDQVIPEEVIGDRVAGRSRRLSQDADSKTAFSRAIQFREAFSGQISPDGHRFLAKDAARAAFGDPIADMLIPDNPAVDRDQVSAATIQNAMALSSLLPPQRNPEDNPQIHMTMHLPAISRRVVIAQKAGGWAPAEKEGVRLLLEHCALDVPGLPNGDLQMTIQALQQIARVVASIPVSGASTDIALKEREASRRQEELLLKAKKEANVVADRERKADLRERTLLLGQSQLLEQQSNNSIVKAGQLMRMAQNANETFTDEVEVIPPVPNG